MNKLKPGWKKVKFGDVVRQCKESVDRDNNPFGRYVEGGHMDSDNFISAGGANLALIMSALPFIAFSGKDRCFTDLEEPI